jgi:WD40 repeat protein
MNDTANRDYLPDSPYPGIEPFSYAGRNVFFARETEARTLIRLIVMYRGVLLYSDSGTGKSSLVNAGLIPLTIDEGYQPERIRIQPTRGQEIIAERISEKADGEPPFLLSIFTSDEEQERIVLSVEKFLETVRQRARDVRPLLIFDQFEEWVTLFEQSSPGQAPAETRASKERILNALVELINDSELPAKVLIVFREDYLAKLTPLFKQCPNLPDQYLRLTPLKVDQIYRVIRGPFEEYPERYWPEISPSLAKQIQMQFEARTSGADLCLTEVQIVCRSLFETGREGPELDQLFIDEDGVQGILEQYLEGALESLKDDQQEPAVGLLSRMVTPAGTRNVISRDDLLNLVASEDKMSHELLGETLDSLEQQTKLVRRERRREVHYYELASPFLVEWIRNKAQERKRLAEQRKLEEAQRTAQKKDRIARTRGGLAVALAVALLIAALASCMAFRQRNDAVAAQATAETLRSEAVAARVTAEAEHARAEQQAREARRASSGLLAMQAQAVLEEYPQRGLLLAVEALNVTLQAGELPVPVAENALRQALASSGGRGLSGHEDWMTVIAISPDNHWLATGSRDNSTRLWDLTTPDPDAEPIVLRGHEDWITAIAINADNHWLATGSRDNTTRLWDLTAPDPATAPIVLRGHESWITAVAISPNSHWLVTGSWDNTARLWDLAAADPAAAPIVLHGHEGPISAVAISPDNHWLATGSGDATARLWDLTAPNATPIVLHGHEDWISAVAIGADGHWLATGSDDTTARLWDLTAPDPATAPIVLRGHEGSITAIAISPDNHWLVTGSRDKTTRLWDLTAPDPDAEPLVLHGHEDWISAIAISPDNHWLATGSDDATARLWDLTASDPAAAPIVLRGHEGSITAIAISPGNYWLVNVSKLRETIIPK